MTGSGATTVPGDPANIKISAEEPNLENIRVPAELVVKNGSASLDINISGGSVGATCEIRVGTSGPSVTLANLTKR